MDYGTVDYTMAQINRLTVPIRAGLDMESYQLATMSSSSSYSLISSRHMSHSSSVFNKVVHDPDLRDASMFLLLLQEALHSFTQGMNFSFLRKQEAPLCNTSVDYQTKNL